MLRIKCLRRVVVALAALLTVATPSVAQTYATTISGYDLASALNKAIAGTTIHLHNLGTLKGSSYHASDASSVKWPLSFGPGRRSRFTIPEANRDILGRRYAYYVDHVRSETITASAGAETITLSIGLGSAGPALVGRCIKLGPTPKPCATLGDDVLPGIEWQNARVDLVLKPIVFERSLAFSVEDVTVGGTFDVGNACDLPVIGRKLCLLIERQATRLRAQVAREVKSALDQAALKRETAAAVRQYLDEVAAIPALGVRKVAMADGAVAITFGLGR